MSTSTVSVTPAATSNLITNATTVLTAVPAMCPTITDLIAQTSGVLGSVEAAGGHVMDIIEAVVNDSEIWKDVESVFNGVVSMIKSFHFGSASTILAATTPASSTITTTTATPSA